MKNYQSAEYFISVPPKIDEAGLSAAQFRVLAHISRWRPSCLASIEAIAKTCRMDERTVKKSLKELESRGLLTRQERAGKTTVWTVNPA